MKRDSKKFLLGSKDYKKSFDKSGQYNELAKKIARKKLSQQMDGNSWESIVCITEAEKRIIVFWIWSWDGKQCLSRKR